MTPVLPLRRLRQASVSLALLLAGPACLAQLESTGEIRVFRETRALNPRAASAIANQLAPVTPTRSPGYTGIEAGFGLKTEYLKLDTALLVYGAGDRQVASRGRFNEAYLSTRRDGLQFSAGRRIVDWDVGFGFKPNSVVQQDLIRPLLSTKRQGRTVLQVESFGTDLSGSLVWVNPQNHGLAIDRQRGAAESALAGQLYYRAGSVDLYGFGRYGRHTGPSVGAAAAAVLTDSLSVHGSLRALRRHDGYSGPGADLSVLGANPWVLSTQGRANQYVLGATWTGASKQALLVEYWYDGTALSDRQWSDWRTRTDTLRALLRDGLAGTGLSIPAEALAGNLAWQDFALSSLNQRRQNLLVRASWQPDAILLALDAVFNPTDRGLVYTASGQWQGDGLRLNAAVRWFAGPDTAIARNLPQKLESLVAATWIY